MAFTQTDLDKLDAAIASGARRVKFADREVEYQDIKSMREAREMIRKELGLTNDTGNRRFAKFSKGTT